MKISPSSYNNFLSCQTRWYHSKVLETEFDRDYNEPDYLDFGTRYHKVLEDCKHDLANYVPVDDYKLHACVTAYLEFRQKDYLGIKLLASEIEVEGALVHGIIDAVMVSKEYNHWYILDTKTSSKIQSSLGALLPFNIQMNIYQSLVPELSKKLGLDPHNSRGCLYNVVEKPKSTIKISDNHEVYYERTKPRVEEFIVETFNNLQDVKQVYRYMMDIINGKYEPIRNYNACMNYNSPCPYWSQCYGYSYSDFYNMTVCK